MVRVSRGGIIIKKLYCVFQDKNTDWSEQTTLDQDSNSYPVYLCEDCLPKVKHWEDKVLVDTDESELIEKEAKLGKLLAELVSSAFI